MNNSRKQYSINQSQRGSALIITLFFAIVISAIVGIYIKLATGDLKLADRAFMYNALIHLAEEGAEEATWALLNDNVDWTGWTEAVTGSKAKIITGLDLGNGKAGTVYVVVEDFSGSNPTIYAEAQVQLPSGKIVSKQIMIELSGRSLFADGMIARDTLTLGGSVSVDSYDSSLGAYNAITNRNANVTIGSISTSPNKVVINGANIWGYIGTGESTPTITNSTVKGPETPAEVTVDPNRISSSLSAQFEDPVAPDTTGYTIDLPGGNSISGIDVVNIGTASGPLEEYFLTADLRVGASATLRVNGPVVIVMDTNKSIDVIGTAKIEIIGDGSLTFYTDGDISIGGVGIFNDTTVPSNIIIYGTETIAGGQTISLASSASLQAVIYTPNANISFSGTPDSFGAIVANTISMSGSSTFHYDEALANFYSGSKPDAYEMNNWLELSDIADKVNLTSYFP